MFTLCPELIFTDLNTWISSAFQARLGTRHLKEVGLGEKGENRREERL
jgi:hypothetical protein